MQRGQSQRDDCKSQEENDKDRVDPDPPIALFNSLKFLCELLVSRIHGSLNVMGLRGNHGVEVGATFPIQSSYSDGVSRSRIFHFIITSSLCPKMGIDFELIQRNDEPVTSLH